MRPNKKDTKRIQLFGLGYNCSVRETIVRFFKTISAYSQWFLPTYLIHSNFEAPIPTVINPDF